MSLTTELHAAGIIEETDIPLLDKSLDEFAKPSECLSTLLQFFYNKMFGNTNGGGAWISISGFEDYAEPPANETEPYRTLLNILYHHNLIPQPLHQKLSSFPLKGDKTGYMIALHLITEWVSFYENFSLENQLEFANQLSGNDPYSFWGMLNESKKKKLIKDIKAGKLQTYLDFFKYSYCCDFIDVAEYKGKHKPLLKKLTAILNNLCYEAFTILNISIQESDFSGYPSYDNKQATLTIDTGAQLHRHSYTFSDQGKNSGNRSDKILEELLVAVNQLLMIYAAPYRFVKITNSLNTFLFPGSRSVHAICRLSQHTENIFEFYSTQRRRMYATPLHVTFAQVLSYTHIQYAVHHFNKIGIFSHLTQDTINHILSRIYETTYASMADLLAVFPDTLAVTNRNILPGQKPYEAFLLSLNNVSKGVLTITDINDQYPENIPDGTNEEIPFTVSFKCNGIQHEFSSDAQYQEFDDRILYYIINEIIRKHHPEHQLMQLINGNYKTDYFLFATNEQAQYLHKMKLKNTVDRF